jgi:alanyl-tRNA synthetase
MTMLVSDGVLPTNEGRGYVLRRLIRRAVLAARRLGTDTPVTPALAASAVEVMGRAYPVLVENLGLVQEVVEREERGFDRTLRTGLSLLEEAMAEASERPARRLSGEVAFRLHDTHGFPIELTEELAAERGLTVERDVFDSAMEEQRNRARLAARTPAAADEHAYRLLLDDVGPTTFVGREHYTLATRVTAVLAGSEPGTAEIFLDRTPFYAEGGGQVGDTGTIVTETGRAVVYDTKPALPGLVAHRARVEGEIYADQDALATIDGERRDATRRNHTGTHLLHAALRQVLGDHVRQQGSLVAPGRLRFDFSHSAALAPEELEAVVRVANEDVLTDDEVHTTEATKVEAEAMGAVAFFGDKYGDVVRVVRAGPHSLEFCGGTHVGALGSIGPISVVSEGSIGSNTRRIEALTGRPSLERSLERDAQLAETATLLRTEPDSVVEALERLLERQRSAEKELARLRDSAVAAEAAALVAEARDGTLVARRDGRSADELRALALAARRSGSLRAVVLGGSPDGTKVSIVAATGGQPDAGALVKSVAAVVGGGGGGSPEVAVAGGREPGQLDEALAQAARLLDGG